MMIVEYFYPLSGACAPESWTKDLFTFSDHFFFFSHLSRFKKTGLQPAEQILNIEKCFHVRVSLAGRGKSERSLENAEQFYARRNLNYFTTESKTKDKLLNLKTKLFFLF